MIEPHETGVPHTSLFLVLIFYVCMRALIRFCVCGEIGHVTFAFFAFDVHKPIGPMLGAVPFVIRPAGLLSVSYAYKC